MLVQIYFGTQKFSSFRKVAYYRFCIPKPWHGLQQHAMLRLATVSVGKPECSSKVQRVLTWNCLELIQVGFWYQDSYDKSVIFKACCTWEMWVGRYGILSDFPGRGRIRWSVCTRYTKWQLELQDAPAESPAGHLLLLIFSQFFLTDHQLHETTLQWLSGSKIQFNLNFSLFLKTSAFPFLFSK